MVTEPGQRAKYLNQFRPGLSPVMKKIWEEGIENKVPIIGDDVGFFLKLICSIHKPLLILEIGCGISYATHWMLSGWSKSRIVAIDSNHDRVKRCEHYLSLSNMRERVELIHAWADDYYRVDQRRFDLIFQDATKRDYVKMIDACYQRLNVGGLFIADNLFFDDKVIQLSPEQLKKYENGVNALKSFTKKMSQHPGFECTFLDYGDGILVAKRIK